MNKEEIVAKNLTIAKFMGKTVSDITLAPFTNKLLLSENEENATEWQEAKYHCDWNWLHAVIEKIEAIRKYDTEWYSFEISKTSVRISGVGQVMTRSVSVEGSKIIATWLLVLDFIKFYNEKNNIS